jgi:hypothetical protein
MRSNKVRNKEYLPMANESAQRTDYGNKTGEVGHDKEISSKPAEMIKAGGNGADSGRGGPTGSSRVYPKGSKVDLTPDFSPMKRGERTGTDWAVGGV